MFCGFFGLHRAYIDDNRDTSTLLLAFFMCLTGMGSCAGISILSDLPMLRVQCRTERSRKEFPCISRYHLSLIELNPLGTATAFPVGFTFFNGLLIWSIDSISGAMCLHVRDHCKSSCPRGHGFVPFDSWYPVCVFRY